MAEIYRPRCGHLSASDSTEYRTCRPRYWAVEKLIALQWFSVNEILTIWKLVYDLLLMFCCNYMLYASLLSFPKYNFCWGKVYGFSPFLLTPVWFKALARGFSIGRRVWKLVSVTGLPDTEICMILRLLVLTHYQNVANRQTDRQTPPVATSRSSIAECDKI